MKRVIVTGATGLIGLALIEECIKNNCEVYAIVRPGSLRTNVLPVSKLIHIIECDLSRLQTLEYKIQKNCDVFYHFGWGHTGFGKDLDIKFQTENINYTIDAVRCANKIGCKLFVGSGSQAEYGPLEADKISPDSPTKPKIAYGVCKLAAGNLAKIECNKLSLKCVWVRIFSTYGKNDKKDMLMGSVIQKMLNKEHISMTKGIQQWDYLYCTDAGRAFYLIGDKCKKDAIYCLGSGKKRPLHEYIDLIAKKINYTEPIGYGDIPYTSTSVMNLCADISSLTHDTGFLPSIEFEQGIDEYIRYVKSTMF